MKNRTDLIGGEKKASEDNKGGLQIRGESGFGKEGKEGCLTMKKERITGK